ncbi:MAG: glycosyltransferase family 4 protein [Terracidiphilus sp.]
MISSSLGYYGAERVVVTLSEALEQSGVHTVVAAFHNTAKVVHLEVLEEAKARGLATERIECGGRFDCGAVRRLREIVDHHQVDVIHCHGIKPDLYALLACARGKAALVSTCHLWVFDSGRDWLISAVERCFLHGFDNVVAVSESIVPELRRFGLRGEVIQNGIDLRSFREPESNLRESLGWKGRPIVGAVGRLARQKGLQHLLRAAPAVLQESPDTMFVFAGDGPERDALEREAARLGVLDSVCFLGVREDIPTLLASIDVLAMPSLSEGLPMALLEAMACGKAVIASAVGAIPQMIADRVNGWLIDPADEQGLAAAMRGLIMSPELRASMGREARRTIESRFSAEIMAERHVELYRKATAHKASGQRTRNGS